MDDVEKVCDRVVVINYGKKIYDARLDSLMEDYRKERVVIFYFDDVPSAMENFENTKEKC